MIVEKVKVGTVCGRLTVISKEPSNNHKKSMWSCRCECGNMTRVTGSRLTEGNKTVIRSCGCVIVEKIRLRNYRHGLRHSKVYNAWRNMKRRCYSTVDSHYHSYGGRGITVCGRWLESFENFLQDMGIPEKCLSLDRVDTNGNYSKENCRWATNKQQATNKRNTVMCSLGDLTLPLITWAEKTGIALPTLYQRLQRGWTDEETLTIPLGGTT